MKALFFYSQDDKMPEATAALASVVANETSAEVRVVHKLGDDLEQLRLIARHKVVTTPTVLILAADDRAIYRKVGTLPDVEELVDYLREYAR